MNWNDTSRSFNEGDTRAASEELGYRAEAAQPGNQVFATVGGDIPLVAANPSRRELTVCCDSTSTGSVIYLRLAESGAEAGEGIRLGPGQIWQSTHYTGAVCVTAGGSAGVRATFSEI